MTMPDRNAKDDPERDTYDPEPYRQRALDDVIETIMLFGQWPQPRTGRTGTSVTGWYPVRRVEFDLRDWLVENYEPDELARFMVTRLCPDDDTDMLQLRTEREIEAKLRVELAESGMVDDVIESLHEDERAEHDGR